MPMSQEHKDALAEGRKQARAIKAYLKAIQGKRRGRPVTRESLDARLAAVNQKLEGETDPLRSVELIQKRMNLEKDLAAIGDTENMEELEVGFVEYASDYSERKGISYSAWREAGVAAAVLRKAGVKETRRR